MNTSKPPPAPASGNEPAPASTHPLEMALGQFASAATVITAGGSDGKKVGILLRSFTPMAAGTPMVVWSAARSAASTGVFQTSSHWAVHILAYDQADLATHFANGAADPFAGLAHTPTRDGVPALSRSAARFLCRNIQSHEVGDHLIMIGEVMEFETSHIPPLLCYDNGFAIATSIEGQPMKPSESPTAATSLSFLLGSAYFYLYGKLGEVGGDLGFTNLEMFVLTALGERAWRSRREIKTLLAYGGQASDLNELDDLEACGLIISREGAAQQADDAEFALTVAGQAVFVKFSQAGLEVERAMEDCLGAPETIALRALLSRFTKKTDTYRAVKWV